MEFYKPWNVNIKISEKERETSEAAKASSNQRRRRSLVRHRQRLLYGKWLAKRTIQSSNPNKFMIYLTNQKKQQQKSQNIVLAPVWTEAS